MWEIEMFSKDPVRIKSKAEKSTKHFTERYKCSSIYSCIDVKKRQLSRSKQYNKKWHTGHEYLENQYNTHVS